MVRRADTCAPPGARRDRRPPPRIWDSLRTSKGVRTGLAEFRQDVEEARTRIYTSTEPVPLESLTDWRIDQRTGVLRHRTGGFFSVEGADVQIPNNTVPHWNQPVINQPETGILGILVKEFDGILHCLMQLKAEPGNHNGLQLSPTVQATRSNYTGVHRGRPVPYLDYFQNASRHHVVADVRQSEQGAWFLRKRNRNMIVEVTEQVEQLPGFHWLSLGQVHRLLALDDMVNMDTRTVLACLPLTAPGPPEASADSDDAFTAALLRSCDTRESSAHRFGDILSWITDTRTRTDVNVQRVPLHGLAEWRHEQGRISHRSGRFFDVIGVQVEASGREVARWSQPMIAARSTGVVAFLVTRIQGVLHALVQLRAEPGYVDAAELAPTVQCAPENYAGLPSAARPAFLEEVLEADPRSIRFDTMLSEEGGRFYHTRNRHLIVETDEALEHPDFRWMPLHQLTELLKHSHYLNVEARSLVACLRALAVPAPAE